MRVLVADDHALVRDGIAGMLRAEGFEVVGEASSGEQAIEQARALDPDLVLMDVTMPGIGGIEAMRRIKAAMPDIAVVMLTVSDDEQNLLQAVRAGAAGYLLKDVSPAELFDSLRAIERGEAVIPRRMAAGVLDEFRALSVRDGPARPEEALTPREREVMVLVAEGRTNKEVAEACSLSPNTVKSHMRKILEKLHLQNRAQVAAWAALHGMIQRGPD